MIRTFDLSAAPTNISIKDARYGAVVRLQRNIAAVSCIHTDLREAKQALEPLGIISPAPQKDPIAGDSALLSEAIFCMRLFA